MRLKDPALTANDADSKRKRLKKLLKTHWAEANLTNIEFKPESDTHGRWEAD
jgi:hypothetical protein